MNLISAHDTADHNLTVVERIAEELAQRILDGRLAPGSRLRQEEFAFELGVSHVTVREAFRRLELQNLVESQPRRGVRVTPLDARSEREIIAMRVALEGMALRHITGRVSRAQLQKIRAALEDGDRAEDIMAAEAANRDFHNGLAAPCGMPRLNALIAELNLAYSRYAIANARETPWRRRLNLDHWQIFEAYAAANYELAATLLTGHLGTADRVRWHRA
ncbi:GntR family transcriptional regulator [Aquisediminimonas sediminicola]|uniref:GntR family transcriptional regulator n=1 Tax=Alteraquisediminimonas sediminicola TaxID=2676787 RepID=UPI001C8EBB1D|nr:GntR family transcriptional regulator [Aquisediminimonas sediminicola]